MEIQNKTVLLTGASRGIGPYIAKTLANAGAVLIGLARSEEGLNATKAEIEYEGGTFHTLSFDLKNINGLSDLVEQATTINGEIDILVNNAGSRPGKDRVPVLELEEEAFDEVQRVNVRGTYLVSRAVATHMVNRGGGGKIINISSGAGKRGIARYAAYCASKFAVIGFTQAMAQEMAVNQINVNAICPGLVDTERVDFIAGALAPEGESGEEYRADMVRERAFRVPMGRIAQGDDIARMAAFLASAESDYVTGLSISVSGGSEMS